MTPNGDTGVADERVDPAVAGDRRRHEGADLFGVGNVAGDEEGFAAGVRDGFRGSLSEIGFAVGDDDARSFNGEAQGDGASPNRLGQSRRGVCTC